MSGEMVLSMGVCISTYVGFLLGLLDYSPARARRSYPNLGIITSPQCFVTSVGAVIFVEMPFHSQLLSA